MFLLLMCFFFFVLWGLLLICNKAVVSFVLSLTLSQLFFVAYCYGFRPQAAQWQNTSQILSLHDPAQQQSYTCTHVEQTRMVGCSQKVICPGCSVSLWVRVRVYGFFCAFAVEDTWEWVFAYVRLFACLKCPCLYGTCQRSHGRRKHRVCADRRCQKWHCDSRHGNKCWHLILGDCNWSCRFGYNFVLLCQGIVGSEVRLTPLLWSGLRSVACLDLY